MRATPRHSQKLLLAGALGLGMLAGPAAADAPIKLRVPVKLTKMLAQQVTVGCSIRGPNQEQLGGTESSGWRDIVNGEFDQIIEMTVPPLQGKTFAEAKSYRCSFGLRMSPTSQGAPKLGTPPSAYLPYLAKPNAFFRAEVTGPLDGGTFVDGIAGPKDLTIGPQQKQ